jgi:hypothetical protein
MAEYERQCEKDILDFLLPLDVFLAYAAREVQFFFPPFFVSHHSTLENLYFLLPLMWFWPPLCCSWAHKFEAGS